MSPRDVYPGRLVYHAAKPALGLGVVRRVESGQTAGMSGLRALVRWDADGVETWEPCAPLRKTPAGRNRKPRRQAGKRRPGEGP